VTVAARGPECLRQACHLPFSRVTPSAKSSCASVLWRSTSPVSRSTSRTLDTPFMPAAKANLHLRQPHLPAKQKQQNLDLVTCDRAHCAAVPGQQEPRVDAVADYNALARLG